MIKGKTALASRGVVARPDDKQFGVCGELNAACWQWPFRAPICKTGEGKPACRLDRGGDYRLRLIQMQVLGFILPNASFRVMFFAF
ncbi:MAG: hypothetical protein AB1345_02555 [Chloroflexota bacterium]